MITTLQFIWYFLACALMATTLALVGLDLGTGIVLGLVGKNGDERALLVRTISPHWGGHEVWLISFVSALFAAFPEWYSSLLSGLQTYFLLLIFALVLRVVTIEWRGQVSARIGSLLDWVHTACSLVIVFCFAIIFASQLRGLPVEVINPRAGAIADPSMVDPNGPANPDLAAYVHSVTGSPWAAINLFSLLGAVALIVYLAYVGAVWALQRITFECEPQERAFALRSLLAPFAGLPLLAWAVWGQLAYGCSALGWVLIILLAGALALQLVFRGRILALHVSLATAPLALVTAWVYVAAYPVLLPSTVNKAYDLSINQAASSGPALAVLVGAAALGIPLAGALTWFSHRTLGSRVDFTAIATPFE
ncbi:cytochrome d ubiquinol oxidase subunit II [Winkia sp. UMB10116]|uniref:cytochrome d ubiquinol oxidase subunit II n=1 Tax=Winkia sp. UMB10116 TaxID=3046355 RepID=UPI0025544903|nr:cytochrome d ubiquinol oxidase subunit II [Winkia sp. UMB10116]MDK6240722.1 cytochrome d ubiquinol oxidase subunit II [Winkia sp. UMB10116]